MKTRDFVFIAVVLAASGAACSELDMVGVSTFDQIAVAPAAAEQACSEWSCAWGDCGYDPASDSRGACCVEGALFSGNPVEPEPACGPDGPSTPSAYPECDVVDNSCNDGRLFEGQGCPGYCESTSACAMDIGSFECELA